MVVLQQRMAARFRSGDLSYAMEITLEELQRQKPQTRSSWDDLQHLQRQRAVPSLARKWSLNAPRPRRGARCAKDFSVQQPARSKGTGKLIPEPCVGCHGMKTKNNKTLKLVKSPVLMTACVFAQQATVKSGTNGGLPGDLYIEIRLKARFERDGDDLYAAPSALTAAVFGGEIEVPTLALVKQLLISLEGTQPAAVPLARQGHRRAFQLPGRPVLPHHGGNTRQAQLSTNASC
jgi:molecular chaperone DnaJ